MDRFELEDAIMACWHTADDLQLVAEQVANESVSTDNCVNALVGLQAMHTMRCERVFAIFSALLKTGAIQ